MLRPLYGIPESGLNWYLTYLEYHTEKLGMVRATTDPCVLIRREDRALKGLVMLQVDDTLMLGDDDFITEEQAAVEEFKSKDRVFISKASIDVNGIKIKKISEGRIRLRQEDKIAKLKVPTAQKAFASVRAMCQYIGVNARPDICAPVQLVAPGN